MSHKLIAVNPAKKVERTIPSGRYYLASVVVSPSKKTATTPDRCTESSSESTPRSGKGTLTTLLLADSSQLKGILKGHLQVGYNTKDVLSLCKSVMDEVQEEEVCLIFNAKLLRCVLGVMSVPLVMSMTNPLLVTIVTQVTLGTFNIRFEIVL